MRKKSPIALNRIDMPRSNSSDRQRKCSRAVNHVRVRTRLSRPSCPACRSGSSRANTVIFKPRHREGTRCSSASGIATGFTSNCSRMSPHAAWESLPESSSPRAARRRYTQERPPNWSVLTPIAISRAPRAPKWCSRTTVGEPGGCSITTTADAGGCSTLRLPPLRSRVSICPSCSAITGRGVTAPSCGLGDAECG